MQLRNNLVLKRKCCNCDQELEEQGPISTFLKKVTDTSDLDFEENLFKNGPFEIRELSWYARFKLNPEKNLLGVSIYCYNCETMCEY